MKYWRADENDVDKLAGGERSSDTFFLDVRGGETENMQNGEMRGRRGEGEGCMRSKLRPWII